MTPKVIAVPGPHKIPLRAAVLLQIGEIVGHVDRVLLEHFKRHSQEATSSSIWPIASGVPSMTLMASTCGSPSGEANVDRTARG